MSGFDVTDILSTTGRVTLDDALPLLGRIAEALEARVGSKVCGMRHVSGSTCVLDDLHVGYHVSGDGRLHWLDDE